MCFGNYLHGTELIWWKLHGHHQKAHLYIENLHRSFTVWVVTPVLSTRDDVANGFCVHELLVVFSNSRPIGYYYVMLALLKSGRPIPFGIMQPIWPPGVPHIIRSQMVIWLSRARGLGFIGPKIEASSVSERLGRWSLFLINSQLHLVELGSASKTNSLLYTRPWCRPKKMNSNQESSSPSETIVSSSVADVRHSWTGCRTLATGWAMLPQNGLPWLMHAFIRSKTRASVYMYATYAYITAVQSVKYTWALVCLVLLHVRTLRDIQENKGLKL